MNEGPVKPVAADAPSVGALLSVAVDRFGPRFALRRRREALHWSVFTWTELGQRVRALAAGFLDLGVRHGTTVAILARTRLEWSLTDLALLSIGAVSVPVYHSNTRGQIQHALADSGCELAVVEDAEQLERLLAVRDRLPGLKTVVVIEVMDLRAVPDALLFDAVVQRGSRHLREQAGQLDAAIGAVTRTDLATIVYTSGTTGAGKGVRLSHGNLLAAISSLREALPVGPDDTTVLALPLSHIYARLGALASLEHGYCIAYARRVDRLEEVLREVQPSFFFAVPRIFERLYQRVVAAYRELPPLLQAAVRRGVAVAKVEQGLPLLPDQEGKRRLGRVGDVIGRQIATRAVFAQVQEALGGRVRFCVSGGAPLDVDVARFFRVAGIEILEGYGLTETAAAATINPLSENRIGTVGRPLPGVRVRIASDGEILIGGATVFEGYHNLPEDTEAALEPDGWLHTGDIGTLDEAGYLVITDRKKDIIVTSGGKNVAPQRVEAALRASAYIEDVMVFGDRRPHLVALLTVARPELEEFARGLGLPVDDWGRLLREARVQALIGQEVERINARLASYERVRRWRILARNLSVEGGELTPTLKLRRDAVAERNRPLLESMYSEDPKA